MLNFRFTMVRFSYASYTFLYGKLMLIIFRNRDSAWQQIMAFNSVLLGSSEPVKGLRQLIYCLIILFAYSLHQYNNALNPGILYLFAHDEDWLRLF